MKISLNIIDILCLHIFFWIRSNFRITFIVLCLMKFALTKKCCLNIHIHIYIYIDVDDYRYIYSPTPVGSSSLAKK